MSSTIDSVAKKEDLVGRKFNDWTVVAFHKGGKNRYWWCVCICGKKRSVMTGCLTTGRSKGCGCVRQGRSSHPIHGLTGTPERNAWSAIKARCLKENHPFYKFYGGRGIKVCQGYKESVVEFFKGVGERPSSKHSIDRIDNDGHYSCGKCKECKEFGWVQNLRWATKKEQSRNTRKNRMIKYRGETKTLTEWAEIVKMGVSTLKQRLDRGYTVEEAMTIPLQKHKNRRYSHD